MAKDTVNSVIKVATFDVDATPPIGYQMAYDECKGKWDLGLRAKGIVILELINRLYCFLLTGLALAMKLTGIQACYSFSSRHHP